MRLVSRKGGGWVSNSVRWIGRCEERRLVSPGDDAFVLLDAQKVECLTDPTASGCPLHHDPYSSYLDLSGSAKRVYHQTYPTLGIRA